jgi:hypothetical protein
MFSTKNSNNDEIFIIKKLYRYNQRIFRLEL